MDCDAAAIGPLDFSAGFDALMELKAAGKFPFLCANLRWADNGQPVFEPYAILTRGDVRIGIIGIIDSSSPPKGLGPAAGKLKLQPTFSTVSNYAKILKAKQCDVIIVLSAIEHKKLRLLAKNIRNVDIIIGGDPDDKLKIPFKIRDTTIMLGSHFGKYLGDVELTDDNRNGWYIKHSFVAMKPDNKDDPIVKRIVDGYYKTIALFRSQQPKIYVKENEEAINLMHDHPVFVSSKECRNCHRQEYERWASTKHSAAYQSLPAAARQNLECLECHVTGYGKWGGFVTVGGEPDLTGVQCEECHGPASSHPATMAMRKGREVDGVCRKCHTRSRSPHFNLREYRDRVRCDRGARP